jgi:hypothetical protein
MSACWFFEHECQLIFLLNGCQTETQLVVFDVLFQMSTIGKILQLLGGRRARLLVAPILLLPEQLAILGVRLENLHCWCWGQACITAKLILAALDQIHFLYRMTGLTPNVIES